MFSSYYFLFYFTLSHPHPKVTFISTSDCYYVEISCCFVWHRNRLLFTFFFTFNGTFECYCFKIIGCANWGCTSIYCSATPMLLVLPPRSNNALSLTLEIIALLQIELVHNLAVLLDSQLLL